MFTKINITNINYTKNTHPLIPLTPNTGIITKNTGAISINTKNIKNTLSIKSITRANTLSIKSIIRVNIKTAITAIALT